MIICEFEPVVEGFRPMTLGDRDADWTDWRSLSKRRALINSWIAPTVRFLKHGEVDFSNESTADRTDSDRPWLSGTLACILSRRAANRLGDLLLRYGELLPVNCDEGEYVVYHCMNQLDDALDADRSDGSRSRDGRLLSLKRAAFRPTVVRQQDIFTIPSPNPYTIFVSDALTEFANRSELQGLRFCPVWTDGHETGSGSG